MHIAHRRPEDASFYYAQKLLQNEPKLPALGTVAAIMPSAACQSEMLVEQLCIDTAQRFHEEADYERHCRLQDILVHAGKMVAVGRMVASINHEIKRPLASMHLLLENTLEMVARDEKMAATDNLALLLRVTDQLIELSRQLETFSRKNPPNSVVLTVQCAVVQALSILSPKIKTGKYNVRNNTGSHYVTADLDRLTLAIVNIVDNAMDATAELANKCINIDTVEEEGNVLIRIRDHGNGIPAMAADRLFESFFTTKPSGKGVGLGLALSSEVVAEMGGGITACNHANGGAEFSIRLPSARSIC